FHACVSRSTIARICCSTSECICDPARDQGIAFIAGMEAIGGQPVAPPKQVRGLYDDQVRVAREPLDQLRVPFMYQRREQSAHRRADEWVVEADDEDSRAWIRIADLRDREADLI